MERRTFLKTCAAAIYSAVAVALGVPALRFLRGPRRASSQDMAFVRVAPVDSLTAGRPTRATIHADRWDAFMHHPPGPVGAVWLTRDEATQDVRCLQVICPHLGCGIEFSAERNAFHCPCHASEFDPDGRRRFGPSPRDMDELPCRITEPDDRGVQWVEIQYTEFHPGRPDKMRRT